MTCSKCKKGFRGTGHYCRKCRSEYMRTYRAEQGSRDKILDILNDLLKANGEVHIKINAGNITISTLLDGEEKILYSGMR